MWNPDDLARYLSVDRSTVSRMETGALAISLDRLNKTATALGVTRVWLLDGVD